MMSNREKIEDLLDDVNEKHYIEVIAYLQQLRDNQTDDERFDAAAAYILREYHKAFEELAK